MSKQFDELMQYRMLEEINRKLSRKGWWWDFSSNLAGNAAWDGILLLASKFIRKLV